MTRNCPRTTGRLDLTYEASARFGCDDGPAVRRRAASAPASLYPVAPHRSGARDTRCRGSIGEPLEFGGSVQSIASFLGTLGWVGNRDPGVMGRPIIGVGTGFCPTA